MTFTMGGSHHCGMTDFSSRPNTIPWPPLLYVAAAAVAVVLNFMAPLPWFENVPRMVLAAAGLCLLCAGVALEIVTVLTFRRHRTTILPHKGASTLITDGPFARSRNPIYVGNTMLMIGLGLLTGIAWFLLTGLGAAILVQKLSIEREERHLARRFGSAWDDYARKTPRWLWR